MKDKNNTTANTIVEKEKFPEVLPEGLPLQAGQVIAATVTVTYGEKKK